MIVRWASVVGELTAAAVLGLLWLWGMVVFVAMLLVDVPPPHVGMLSMPGVSTRRRKMGGGGS